jgi:hypothetical protein
MTQNFVRQTKIDYCGLKLAIQRATSAVTILPTFVSGGKFAEFPTGLFQAVAGNGRYCFMTLETRASSVIAAQSCSLQVVRLG